MVDGFPAPGSYEERCHCAPLSQLDDANPKKTVFGRETMILHLTPEDAKKLLQPLSHSYRGKSLDKLRERIKNKKAVCPPWLQACFYEPDKGGIVPPKGVELAIVGHEGRHRIEAALLEGVEKIPIIVADKKYCPEIKD